jgi:hypothetical protein
MSFALRHTDKEVDMRGSSFAFSLLLLAGAGCEERQLLSDAGTEAELAETGSADLGFAPLPDLLLPDGTAPYTKKNGTCELAIECVTKADCTSKGLRDCKDGRCVSCLKDSDCPSFLKGCDTSTGFCRLCRQDSDCVIAGKTYGTGKCDPATWNCTHCDSDADCAGATFGSTSRCASLPGSSSKKMSMCVGCTSDADCANAQLKGCDLAAGVCNLCRSDSDCCWPGKTCSLTCDKATGECRCSSDAQCQTGLSPLFECR